jgi:hypothetical protein
MTRSYSLSSADISIALAAEQAIALTDKTEADRVLRLVFWQRWSIYTIGPIMEPSEHEIATAPEVKLTFDL